MIEAIKELASKGIYVCIEGPTKPGDTWRCTLWNNYGDEPHLFRDHADPVEALKEAMEAYDDELDRLDARNN